MEDNSSRCRKFDQGKKLNIHDPKMFAAIYAPKKLITWYSACSVLVRLSFDSKNHINKNFL